MAKTATWDAHMKHMSAKDAKNGFGCLLDTARAEPVTIEKHRRAVVVVLSVEEYERLRGLDDTLPPQAPKPEQQGA